MRIDTASQPHIAANHRIVANACCAAQNRGVGIDHNPILDGRMPLGASHKVAIAVSLKRNRAERHALIKLHVAADLTGFADDNTGAVIDKKVIADRGTWMDIDARSRVRPFCHHARNERHLKLVQEMRQPMNCDGLEPRIAKDDFVKRAHGRVTVVGGLHIGSKNFPQIRDLLQKLDGLRLAKRLEVALLDAVRECFGHPVRNSVAYSDRMTSMAMPQCPADLHSEFIVQTVYEITDMVGDIPHV